MRFFPILFLLSLLLIEPSFAYSQSALNGRYEHAMLVWRGFQHRWTYNHRVNRLGDACEQFFCDSASCYGNLSHTSATGKGPDKSAFRSHYTLVLANNITSIAGTVEFEVSGKEGQIISSEKSIAVKAKGLLRNQEDYSVIINGFDLVSLEQADKAQRFSIAVSNGFYDARDTTVRFDVFSTLQFDCNSADCQWFNNTYKYKLVVHYLLIAGKGYTSRSATLNRAYFWDKKHELKNNVPKQTLSGDSVNRYAAALVGFKRITFFLNKPQKTYEWNMALTNGTYDSKTGKYTFMPDLFFKQWSKNMKRRSSSPKHSKFATKKTGLVEISTDVVLLQFKDACMRNGFLNGRMKWLGKDRPAYDDEQAVLRKIVPIKPSCP